MPKFWSGEFFFGTGTSYPNFYAVAIPTPIPFSVRRTRDAGEVICRSASRPEALLTVGADCFSTGVRAMWLRACVSDHVALPVESRNEHGTVVLIAAWLIRGEQRRLTPLRRHISQPFTEATVTEFVGTAEELDGIIGTERSNARLHGPIVLIAKRENVRPHGPSLAFGVCHSSPGPSFQDSRLLEGCLFPTSDTQHIIIKCYFSAVFC